MARSISMFCASERNEPVRCWKRSRKMMFLFDHILQSIDCAIREREREANICMIEFPRVMMFFVTIS